MNRYSKSYTVKAGTVLLSTLLLLGSCSEDAIFDDKGGNLGAASDNICFGISDKDGWPETRSARGGEAEETVTGNFVLRGDDNADTLCVQTTVSDFGPLPFGGNAPMSRAALVTDGTMHESFGVTACIYTGEDKAYYFFNEKNIKPADYNASAIWTYDSGRIYYWPGENHKMRFYAYSPYECSGLARPQEITPGAAPTFSYTVPSDATEQTDILAYATQEMAGDTKTSVPLKFDHICTAVQFVVGKEMQSGSIKSITLKGVKNAGYYSFETNSWTLEESIDEFVHTLNKNVNASAPDDTPKESITDDTNCFVMLPQTLADGASVEIVFHDNTTGKDRTLTASLAGQQWPQGKRVKYNISISADYELEFTSQPETQDAHYVIYPITIKADKVPGGSWTLTSNDKANVTFVETFSADGIKNLVDQGYWLKDYCGNSTLTSSSTGEIKVYVFLKENIADADRDITLTLTPSNYPKATPSTFNFKQYCPAWNDNIGVERIQDKDYPWGFRWDSSMKIKYSMPQGFWVGIWHLLFEIFGNHQYIESTGSAWGGTWTVTVDFSKVPKLNTATSTTNGINNTWELYNFDGINEASTIMAQLESWGGKPDKTLPHNPTEFAAWACAKKNMYGIQTKTDQGQTIYVPTLSQADMVWFLPSQQEAMQMQDNLVGDYWTSTAITDPGTTAYKYTAGGSTSPWERNEVIHVRACRKK